MNGARVGACAVVPRNPPPDVVIAGAAKCGTTALFEYLSAHPAIFMPRHKEPKYFCTDLRTNGGVYDRESYLALFAAAPAGSMRGEASPLYLYSKVAIERLMSHNPDAKVIVMLRHPVDASHSLHAAGWSHKLESIESFEEAWRLQSARLAGECMPPGWPDPATLQYGEMYRYAEQVRRVLQQVPQRQRHFIVYEEFFADPRRHFAEVLDFLQVPPGERAAFPVVNAAVGPRSRLLSRLLRKPPRWLVAAYAPVRPLLRAAGVSPGASAWLWNNVPQRKPALSPAFRSELDKYFAPDIAALEGLLGRRLW